MALLVLRASRTLKGQELSTTKLSVAAHPRTVAHCGRTVWTLPSVRKSKGCRRGLALKTGPTRVGASLYKASCSWTWKRCKPKALPKSIRDFRGRTLNKRTALTRLISRSSSGNGSRVSNISPAAGRTAASDPSPSTAGQADAATHVVAKATSITRIICLQRAHWACSGSALRLQT